MKFPWRKEGRDEGEIQKSFFLEYRSSCNYDSWILSSFSQAVPSPTFLSDTLTESKFDCRKLIQIWQGQWLTHNIMKIQLRMTSSKTLKLYLLWCCFKLFLFFIPLHIFVWEAEEDERQFVHIHKEPKRRKGNIPEIIKKSFRWLLTSSCSLLSSSRFLCSRAF